MCYHKALQKIDEERIEQDWRRKVKTSDFYVECKEEYIEMLFDFASTWDGYLRQINIAKNRFELSPSDAKPVRCVPYRAGLKARDLWIRKEPHGEDSHRKGYQSNSDRTGRTNSFRAQERRIFSFLRRLQKTERCYEARHSSDSTYRIMFWCARRSRSVLYATCQQWVISSLDQKRGSRQNGLCVTTRTLPLWVNAIWITECLKYVSASHGSCAFSG